MSKVPMKKRTIKRKPSKSIAPKRPRGPPRARKQWQTHALKGVNSEDATELQRISSLLSQLQRRNRNQHRGVKWWKWFELLRKKVEVLVRLEGGLKREVIGEEGKSTGEVGVNLKAEDVRRILERQEETRKRKIQVQEWVRDVLLGRCYLAFSNVVRDVQFAALGVVLMGMLARVGSVVGLPRVEVKSIVGISLRETGRGSVKGERIWREYMGEKEEGEEGKEEDFGVLVKREMGRGREELGAGKGKGKEREKQPSNTTVARAEETLTSEGREAEESNSETKQEQQKPPTRLKPDKPNKVKKKKSTIDDLFAGLV